MEPYNKNQEVKPVENQDNKDGKGADHWSKGRVWGGLVIVVVGSLLLAREAGVDFPRWLISPPMALIALGLFLGARNNFRSWYWVIPMGVGVALLVDRIYWEINIKPFIWPAIIVAIGLFMIFRPKRKKGTDSGPWVDWQKANIEANNSAAAGEADTIDSVAIFGSTKKSIHSKNFRGGEVVNFFGGTELNLAQADINGPIMLELVQVFGGAKLIVPSNWRIQSELVSIFGGVDDKRLMQPNIDPNKVLVLKGTNIFGGLEIKSF
jgi:hypothetical protein